MKIERKTKMIEEGWYEVTCDCGNTRTNNVKLQGSCYFNGPMTWRLSYDCRACMSSKEYIMTDQDGSNARLVAYSSLLS